MSNAEQKVYRLNDGSETWSKDGYCESAEIPFFVINPTSKIDAINAVKRIAPDRYPENASSDIVSLPLSKLRFDGYDAAGNINIYAVYEVIDSGGGGGGSTDDEPTINFDCSGGTKHVTHAILQKRAWSKDNKTSDDAGGGIGWNGKYGNECEFAGVDVPCADMRETYTKIMSVSQATRTSYKRNVASLVGKVNSKKWKGWEAGEVMFLGCSYSTPASGANKVTVTFNFRIQPNEDKLTVAGHNFKNKKGFYYMWARSKTIRDTQHQQGTAVMPRVDVEAIYVSQVAEEADFGVLGL